MRAINKNLMKTSRAMLSRTNPKRTAPARHTEVRRERAGQAVSRSFGSEPPAQGIAQGIYQACIMDVLGRCWGASLCAPFEPRGPSCYVRPCHQAATAAVAQHYVTVYIQRL